MACHYINIHADKGDLMSVSIRIGNVEFKCLVDEYEEDIGFEYGFETGNIKLDEFLNENFDDTVQEQLDEYKKLEAKELEQWKMGI